MVRVKKRYLLIELIAQDDLLDRKECFPVDELAVLNSIRSVVKTIHGDYGLASVYTSLHCKRFNKSTRIALISCLRGPHYLIMSSLPFVKTIDDLPISLNQLHLSGTIQGSLKFLRKYYYQQIKKSKYDLEMIKQSLKSFEKAAIVDKYEND